MQDEEKDEEGDKVLSLRNALGSTAGPQRKKNAAGSLDLAAHVPKSQFL